jgi:hypothetical protein
MKYLLSLILFVLALVLSVFGIMFRQIDLDIAGIFFLLLAIGVFLYSSLHLSLWIRPRGQRGSGAGPRSDKEQNRLLGQAIFRDEDEPHLK